MANRSYRYWRRLWYRRRRRYFRKNKRVVKPTDYSTKQKLDFSFPLTIPQGNTSINQVINMSNVLTSSIGWQNFSTLFGSVKIYFISCDLNVSVQSTTLRDRQMVVFGFYPNVINAQRTQQELLANNASGYSQYATDKRKRLLWRSNSAVASVVGYGSPIQINIVQTITGCFVFRNMEDIYFQHAPVEDTIVGTINIHIYVNFYSPTA